MIPLAQVLREVAHRPWPLPAGPWVMTQAWHDLLFAHWPVDAEALRAAVPPALEIDTHDGQAWLGIVPFGMARVYPRGLFPMPWISKFLELNVRTYVKVNGRFQKATPGHLLAEHERALLGSTNSKHAVQVWYTLHTQPTLNTTDTETIFGTLDASDF